MAVWKKFVLHPTKAARRFKTFSKTAKNVGHLEGLVKRNKALKTAIKAVFSKTTVKLTVGATLVGVGVTYLNNYIQSNSGCFVKSHDAVCKVQALSCCQPEAVEKVPFCTLKIVQPDPCRGFDEEVEKSCCKWCDCQYHDCLPHQTMECRRPTIGDALGYYAQQWTSSIWDMLDNVFPWIAWVLGIGGVFLAVWLGLVLYKKARSR